MAKKPEPIITHTEIICRTIRDIDREIHDLYVRSNAVPDEVGKPWFQSESAPLKEKREALKTMYRIETGTDYD